MSIYNSIWDICKYNYKKRRVLTQYNEACVNMKHVLIRWNACGNFKLIQTPKSWWLQNKALVDHVQVYTRAIYTWYVFLFSMRKTVKFSTFKGTRQLNFGACQSQCCETEIRTFNSLFELNSHKKFCLLCVPNAHIVFKRIFPVPCCAIYCTMHAKIVPWLIFDVNF